MIHMMTMMAIYGVRQRQREGIVLHAISIVCFCLVGIVPLLVVIIDVLRHTKLVVMMRAEVAHLMVVEEVVVNASLCQQGIVVVRGCAMVVAASALIVVVVMWELTVVLVVSAPLSQPMVMLVRMRARTRLSMMVVVV
jgi:hypothetical protein